jgi:hypothetical protein
VLFIAHKRATKFVFSLAAQSTTPEKKRRIAGVKYGSTPTAGVKKSSTPLLE